jgi:hypothetical protein
MMASRRPEDDEDRDDYALDHDHAHRGSGRHAKAAVGLGRGQVVRDDGVDSEAGGKSERVVGDQAHRDRQDTGAKAGSCGDCDRVKAEGLGDDGPVQEDDVAHHHERGQTCPGLGDDVRAALRKLEVAGYRRQYCIQCGLLLVFCLVDPTGRLAPELQPRAAPLLPAALPHGPPRS